MICAENDFCTLELGKWRIWQRTIISIPKGRAGPGVLRHTKQLRRLPMGSAV